MSTIDVISDQQALDLARRVPKPSDSLLSFIASGEIDGHLPIGNWLTLGQALPEFVILQEYLSTVGQRGAVSGWDPEGHLGIPEAIDREDVYARFALALSIIGPKSSITAAVDRKSVMDRLPKIEHADQEQLRSLREFIDLVIGTYPQ